MAAGELSVRVELMYVRWFDEFHCAVLMLVRASIWRKGHAMMGFLRAGLATAAVLATS